MRRAPRLCPESSPPRDASLACCPELSLSRDARLVSRFEASLHRDARLVSRPERSMPRDARLASCLGISFDAPFSLRPPCLCGYIFIRTSLE